jgi:hypothetical protein
MRQKTGGRKEGTPNKVTRELRETLKVTLANELEQIPELLNELSTEKRLDYLMKLLPYVLPKVQTIEMNKGEPLDEWTL